MFEALPDVAEYKLTDLLSSAGATIGIIIAGTIFLQFLSAKYQELAGRYRALTREYRTGGVGDTRHGLLQSQIRAYRRRLRLINRASWLAAIALLCFILAVLAGGFSVMYPPIRYFKWIGTAGLICGLTLIGAALFLEISESVLAEHDHAEEVGDLDDPVKVGPY